MPNTESIVIRSAERRLKKSAHLEAFMDLEKVSLAVDALAADHARQGGHLDLDDFIKVTARRNLGSQEARLVFDELRLRGVDLNETPAIETPKTKKPERRASQSRHCDGFGNFLDAVSKTPLLDAAAERVLGRRIRAAQIRLRDFRSGAAAKQDPIIKAGCDAIRELVESNIRLVVSVARGYNHTTHLEFDDLVQHGILGLMRAAQKYDPELGYKFSTYATCWIKQSIQRAIADEDRTIRIPVHVVETLARMRKVRKSLGRELGRKPNDAEIAEQLDISPEKVRFLLDISRTPVSIDAPVNGDEEGSSISDFLPSRCKSALNMLIESDCSDAILDVLKSLTPREEQVIKLRFGLNGYDSKTLQTIGDIFFVTRERIRQIEFKALKKLRHPTRQALIRDFARSDP